MELRGSQTEESIRRDLLASWQALSTGANPKLWQVLTVILPNLSCAFVIDWIPEQGEDFYAVLLENEKVVMVEIPKAADEVVAKPEVITLIQYKKALRSTRKRLELAVALDMLRNRK
jgi:hypothetical protein